MMSFNARFATFGDPEEVRMTSLYLPDGDRVTPRWCDVTISWRKWQEKGAGGADLLD